MYNVYTMLMLRAEKYCKIPDEWPYGNVNCRIGPAPPEHPGANMMIWLAETRPSNELPWLVLFSILYAAVLFCMPYRTDT